MKNWKEISLGDAATFINGYAFKPSDWSSDGKEIIRIQNLTRSSSETNYFQGEIDSKYIVKQGDLLISWSATLGIYEWNREDAWLNQHIFKVVFNKQEFDKNFFKHLISSSLRRMAEQVHGATMKHITKKKFDAIKVPLPPLETQQKIAAILDKAQSLCELDRQIIQKYDQLAQSLFLDMFGDTWLNPKGWDIKYIEDIAKDAKHSIKAGPFGSSLKKEIYVRKGYKIYGQEQVIRDDLTFGDYYIDETKYRQLESCKVSTGDILISLVGTYGKISVVPENFEPGIINPRLMKISPNQELIRPDFLKRLLQSAGVELQMKNQSRGGTMDIVNVGIIKKIKIPIPPLSMQNEYASRLDLIIKQKQLALQSLQKSEEFFQSLLQSAFAGGFGG